MPVNAVDVLLFAAYLAIAFVFGAFMLPKIIEDVGFNLSKASTHSIALDIASFSSLTAAATGDIKIDYEIPNGVNHDVVSVGKLVEITRVEDPDQNFRFSLPFSLVKFGKNTQSGTNFRIFKIDGEYGIVKNE